MGNVNWDLHMVRVEPEQFCKKQSWRELNSLQDNAICYKIILKNHLIQSVLNWEQLKLGTIKVEIIHAVEGLN